MDPLCQFWHAEINGLLNMGLPMVSYASMRVFSAFLGGFLALSANPVLAEGSQTPQPDVQLIVSFPEASGRAPVELTMQDLAELPQNGFETSTIWSNGLQRFDGVLLTDLAAHLEVDGEVLELSALNEYLVDFDMSLEVERQALVATSRNGEPMSSRDKGPLWVVFPYDKDEAFQTETVYALSIWQLDRISVLE